MQHFGGYFASCKEVFILQMFVSMDVYMNVCRSHMYIYFVGKYLLLIHVDHKQSNENKRPEAQWFSLRFHWQHCQSTELHFWYILWQLQCAFIFLPNFFCMPIIETFRFSFHRISIVIRQANTFTGQGKVWREIGLYFMFPFFCLLNSRDYPRPRAHVV